MPSSNDSRARDERASTTAPQHHPDHLASLGWDDAWQRSFDACVTEHASDRGDSTAQHSLAPRRVVAEHRGRHVVSDGITEHDAVISGRLRHQARSRDDLPAVGDWVVVATAATTQVPLPTPHSPLPIHQLLPRRSAFRRNAAGTATEPQVVAANIDVALVLASVTDPNPRRLERFVAMAWESGAVPVVVLTKRDLSDDVPGAIAEASLAAPGADVVAISAAMGDGLDAIAPHIAPGCTAVLLGASGVGKSTLANALLGRTHLRTSAVRDDGKGRHTTTHRELLRLPGGALLVDTPGMRELQLWASDGDAHGVDATFPDIDALAERCRFRDCAHEHEPGCAVLAAAADGSLDADRLEHWRKLRRELAWLHRRVDEHAMREYQSFVKRVHRTMRDVGK